jgi:hypothetical protein
VEVDHPEALAAWTTTAYPVLMDVARTYHAVITYGELAKAIQEGSGVHTRTLLHNWIGRVLGGIVREAHRIGDPPLTALVVHAVDGMVGEGYREVLQVADLPPASDELDRENHAAQARLECYRKFCTTLPAGGGTAALAPRYQTTIARRRAATTVERPSPLCPGCYVQLPITGICDNCS